MKSVISMKEVKKFLNNMNVPIVGMTEPFSDAMLTEVLLAHEKEGRYIYFGDTTVEQRQHIEAVFPVCKSIIVIGVPYNSKNKNIVSDENSAMGFVSNMAWEYDYHAVVKSKLRALQGYLEERDEMIDSLIQVDTGPLIDRHIAYKSGIGAYGKNQCLMHKDYGTEFYIGYLLINKGIEDFIQEDKALHDERCNNCSKCVKSCPAKVLTDSYDFYGQRCISYLTQKKTYLSWEERKLIGASIYGCDICQLVCPSNDSKAKVPDDYQRKSLNRIELKVFIKTSNKQLMRIYKETGFSWRGAKVLKRNAIIALGNQKNRENAEFLKDLLESSNDYLVPYILWALHKSESDQVKELCKKIFSQTEDEIIKKECQLILAIL